MARRGSPVRIFAAKFANVQGADQAQQVLASFPSRVAELVQVALEAGADKLVAQARAIAPVAPAFETHPGQLRDNIRRAANGRALSVSVVVDARDPEGRMYPSFVEHGHTDKRSGVHVPPKPFLWPSYQVTKGAIRSGLNKAILQAVREIAP